MSVQLTVDAPTRSIFVQRTGGFGPPGILWRDEVNDGTWAPDIDFRPRDGTFLAGSSYRCILAHTSSDENRPGAVEGNTYWRLMASIGGKGDQGDTGDMDSTVYDPNERGLDVYSMDSMVDGAARVAMTVTERGKLAGVAEGATANSSDAALRSRADHTGTQLAETISDFSTAADARISAAIGATVMAYSANLAEMSAVNPGAAGLTALAAADAAALRSAAELGTAAVAAIGTSGNTVPKNNTANVFSETQKIQHPTGFATLIFERPSGQASTLDMHDAGVIRARLTLYGGAGNFQYIRYDASGVGIDVPFSVAYATGIVSMPNGAVVGDAAGDPVTLKGTVVSEWGAGVLGYASAAAFKTAIGLSETLVHVPGGWQTATGYVVGNWLTHNDVVYICTAAHTSGSTTEPGVGASWTSYWDPNPFGLLAVSNVANSQLATRAQGTIMGRGASSGTGVPEDLSASAVRTILNVADGATANASDAALRARADHTGTQAMSTVDGLVAALAAKMGVDFSGATGTIPNARLPGRLAAGGASGTITNWNDALENGVYVALDATNRPAGTSWLVVHVDGNSVNYLEQYGWDIFRSGGADSGRYRRALVGGEWSAWEKIRITDTELDARYTRTFVQSGEPAGAAVGSIWLVP